LTFIKIYNILKTQGNNMKKSSHIVSHGDTTKIKGSLRGHSFNPATGFIDTILDNGERIPSFQVMEPQDMSKVTYVVGSSSPIKLEYNMGPSKWINSAAMICLPKNKA
jgi:hypothetical protein